MGLRLGQSSLRRVTKSLVVEVGSRVEVLLALRCVSIAGISRVLPHQLRASNKPMKADLDVSLHIDVDLGGTSVRHGENLTLLRQLFLGWWQLSTAHSRRVSVGDRLFELDSLVEGVHQTDGVELGLDALEERAKEGRGSDDFAFN